MDLIMEKESFTSFEDFELKFNAYCKATGSIFRIRSSRGIQNKLPKNPKTPIKVNEAILYEWHGFCKYDKCDVEIKLFHENYQFLKVQKLKLNHINHNLEVRFA